MNKYLSVKLVATRYCVTPATIWRWRKTQSFPPPLKLTNGSTRWLISDLELWESEAHE